jgi:hypothetical protein
MGEAYYSLLAEFPKAPTKKQERAIKDFFLEGDRAYEYWQEHRGQKPKEFWPEFKKQFPVVSEYLAQTKSGRKSLLDGDCGGDLAGYMDFAAEDSGPGNIEDSLKFDGKELTYTAEVWHHATWNPLAEFLKKKFGAIEATWISDGETPTGVDIMRLVKQAKSADIVDAILKQDKKFLMTLIGIHPDLDKRLDNVLRKGK